MISDNTMEHVVGLLEKEVISRSTCYLTQGLQEVLCKGSFSRARMIVGDILNGIKWRLSSGHEPLNEGGQQS